MTNAADVRKSQNHKKHLVVYRMSYEVIGEWGDLNEKNTLEISRPNKTNKFKYFKTRVRTRSCDDIVV